MIHHKGTRHKEQEIERAFSLPSFVSSLCTFFGAFVVHFGFAAIAADVRAAA